MIYKSSNYKQQKNIADNRQIPLQKIINKQTQYKKIKKSFQTRSRWKTSNKHTQIKRTAKRNKAQTSYKKTPV